jgi:hypothetical protein
MPMPHYPLSHGIWMVVTKNVLGTWKIEYNCRRQLEGNELLRLLLPDNLWVTGRQLQMWFPHRKKLSQISAPYSHLWFRNICVRLQMKKYEKSTEEKLN